MKKAFLLATILFISVISTACINNFAVQELNNKAQDFMEKGDYASAIERLKSSVDLDGSIFETQYNLAVAYTKAEDYANAIKSYNDAIGDFVTQSNVSNSAFNIIRFKHVVSGLHSFNSLHQNV